METVEGQNHHQIAPKRIMNQQIVDEGEEDRISDLPNCLILDILSRLPSTKYAIRTGILSKRWKHLWTWVPSLSFENLIHVPSDFVSSVNKTLTQCRQLKLTKFAVCTRYDTLSESQVNNWILYAIRCDVEELNLKLWIVKYKSDFLLDQTFFISSCFTELTLTGCIFNPIEAISWKNLRSLSISYAKLDDDLIKNILSGSPVLETLVLDYCYGYSRLNITSKSVKTLVISGYMIPDDEDDDNDDDIDVNDLINIMEINAPNISSLTIKDDLELWKLLLVNVSSLVKADLDYENAGPSEITSKESEEEMLKGFILNLRHVKELKIGALCSEVLYRLEAKGFTFPSNIKFPDVTTSSLCPDNVLTEIERCSCFTMLLKLVGLID